MSSGVCLHASFVRHRHSQLHTPRVLERLHCGLRRRGPQMGLVQTEGRNVLIFGPYFMATDRL